MLLWSFRARGPQHRLVWLRANVRLRTDVRGGSGLSAGHALSGLTVSLGQQLKDAGSMSLHGGGKGLDWL